jgi:hypothetical protein
VAAAEDGALGAAAAAHVAGARQAICAEEIVLSISISISISCSLRCRRRLCAPLLQATRPFPCSRHWVARRPPSSVGGVGAAAAAQEQVQEQQRRRRSSS